MNSRKMKIRRGVRLFLCIGGLCVTSAAMGQGIVGLNVAGEVRFPDVNCPASNGASVYQYQQRLSRRLCPGEWHGQYRLGVAPGG